ncbi:phosphatase PAP2 family protein [Paraflavisolibacter sp. H34]|uniref:phosphatase PAP2 family protein n=1 Tax=Huijunlia imazamoxiresistens TaxID=3127457 RepID=UPI00301AAD3C
MQKLLCSLLFFLGCFSTPAVWAQAAHQPFTDSLPTRPDTRAVLPAPAAPEKTTKLQTLTISLKQQLSTPLVPKPLSIKAVVIPVAMIGYGAFSLSNKELQELNRSIRSEVGKGASHKTPLEDYSVHAPTAAVYLLNFAGIKGKHNFIDRTLLYGMSSLIGNSLTMSVKNLTQVMRPDSSNQLSFPSGHTTKAFIAAEFLRQEYKDVSPLYGIAGYAVAAGSGFMRMYHNKHWLNDVIAGAGVGILSTRLSYWLYPKLKNSLLKGVKGNTVIAPTYQDGAFGLGMVHNF